MRAGYVLALFFMPILDWVSFYVSFLCSIWLLHSFWLDSSFWSASLILVCFYILAIKLILVCSVHFGRGIVLILEPK